ncbi:hypothetical protein SDC9_114879 [bioreactor metagenome]|uniref:Uncharacterized protein n=1 Tax=bioreactor metagenome TaxID=1076179 RepID=A0A645C1V2_9ZZZZ
MKNRLKAVGNSHAGVNALLFTHKAGGQQKQDDIKKRIYAKVPQIAMAQPRQQPAGQRAKGKSRAFQNCKAGGHPLQRFAVAARLIDDERVEAAGGERAPQPVDDDGDGEQRGAGGYDQQSIADNIEHSREQERGLPAAEIGKDSAGELRQNDGCGVEPDEERNGANIRAVLQQRERQHRRKDARCHIFEKEDALNRLMHPFPP